MVICLVMTFAGEFTVDDVVSEGGLGLCGAGIDGDGGDVGSIAIIT